MDPQNSPDTTTTTSRVEAATVAFVPIPPLPPVPPPPPPEPPKIDFGRLLGKHVAMLLEKYPTAPDLKGLILKHSRGVIYVPDEVPPTEIKAWIVANASGLPAVSPTPPPPTTHKIEVLYTRRESGTATFTRCSTYRAFYEFTDEDLRQAAADCSDVNEFESAVRDLVREGADTDDGECIETGEEDYADHEVGETDSPFGLEITRPGANAIDSALSLFLAANPDVAARLDGEEEEAEDDDGPEEGDNPPDDDDDEPAEPPDDDDDEPAEQPV